MRRSCVRRWCDDSPGCRSSEITATAETADRILNRVWDYPRWLRPAVGDFDLFHIIDHSYAHLAQQLPAGRSLVTCHDLDAFRGVLPGSAMGSIVERALGRRLLAGMRAARKILCVSAATRNELVSAAAIPAERIVVVPNGVHPSYSPRAGARRGSRSRRRFSVRPTAIGSSCCTSAARFRASASTCC